LEAIFSLLCEQLALQFARVGYAMSSLLSVCATGALPDRPTRMRVDRFLAVVAERGLGLIRAEETRCSNCSRGARSSSHATGSGKSLVGRHFTSRRSGRRTVVYMPIKALVNEKFLSLCRDFGRESA